MGRRYVRSSLYPLLIITIITAILVFSIIFITSLSARIDRMLEIFGRGSIYSYAPFDESLLPPDAECFMTNQSEALMYAEKGNRAVIVKGVEDGYFNGMRSEELEIISSGEDALNPVIVSSALASEFSLSLGSRFTLLIYERDKERTRPVLVTVEGIFSSVYPQLDNRLIFAPISIVSGSGGYEILLPLGSDVDSVLDTLVANGVPAHSFKAMNRGAYLNVESSLEVLYFIFALVAILAAYFASDVAEHYVYRDRKDISELLMLGLSKGRVIKLYLTLTLINEGIALIVGTLIGVTLSLFSPAMLEFVATVEPAFLEYYVRSFTLSIPYMQIFLMFVFSLVISSLSILFSLSRSSVANLLPS